MFSTSRPVTGGTGAISVLTVSNEDVPADRPAPGEPPRGEISPRLTSTTRVVHNLRVPMRDGVELALDVLRPDVDDPLPVVLLRTPYDKVLARTASPELYERLAERGYIVAFNDCRGRFNSDGVFRPYFDEADDGFDTVEWIAGQDWCDGNVGMTGGSYVGQTQWYAASRRPPHLKAIVPIVSPPGTLWRNEPIFGGCFLLPMSEWAMGMGLRSWQVPDFVNPLFASQQDYYDALPLTSLPERAGMTCAWWDAMMQHPVFDDFWRQGSYDNHLDIDVAALNITGWWDMNFPGAPLNFEAMHAGPRAAHQKLIIGPWPHWVNRQRRLSGVDFGEHAIIELNDYVIRFFDRYLKGIGNGIEDEKPVHVFVIGANEWRAADTWPLPGTEHTEFYFHSGGRANSLRGDGVLSAEPPESEPADGYRYDPASPTRVLWNLREGPVDDRLATIGDDCLCYTSEPLTEPLDVVGWVTCKLWASSSARDTDWHARLVDVHPDGSAHLLCKGCLRARFRESFETPTLLEPGEPALFEFTMDACGVRFQPGHRIRIEIMSSWFTQYDRNTNTGALNFFADDTIVVADQMVYHERGMASCVVLPVVR
jgi:putative CocE/NonD family hydrolase